LIGTPADPGYTATPLGADELLDELLEEVVEELVLPMVLGCPQLASARIPAIANEKESNCQHRHSIRGRLASRGSEYREFVSFSLAFSNSASQFLHGNTILERTATMSFH
jgi:hypothetical protein